MKGKTRMIINRETLKELIEQHVAHTFVGDFKLHEFTIARNGSVEIVVVPTDPPLSEGRLAFETETRDDEVAN